jgi:hypothetical protein
MYDSSSSSSSLCASQQWRQYVLVLVWCVVRRYACAREATDVLPLNNDVNSSVHDVCEHNNNEAVSVCDR